VASLLEGSLAKSIGRAMSFLFLDATITRDVQGVGDNPADPPPPTQVTYTCKAIEEAYSPRLRADGLVGATDVQVLILATTIKDDTGALASIQPQPLDRITIRGNTVTVVPMDASGVKAVQSDPARATWSCRCRA
jgi:hypothetical protein